MYHTLNILGRGHKEIVGDAKKLSTITTYSLWENSQFFFFFFFVDPNYILAKIKMYALLVLVCFVSFCCGFFVFFFPILFHFTFRQEIVVICSREIYQRPKHKMLRFTCNTCIIDFHF